MISIIIPTRHEPHLQKTINGIFASAIADIEIIVIFDGYWENPILENHPRLTIIHYSNFRGMRYAVNSGVRISKGEYLLKCDGHVLFEKGFDQIFLNHCTDNSVLIPPRYRLNVETWQREGESKEFQYIERGTLKGRDWHEYADRVKGQILIDLLTFQGSCWFMKRSWFDKIGGLDDVNYGWSGREAQEVCLKTWLSGGRCILDRNTWYAHWDKPKEHVVMRGIERRKSIAYAQQFWTEDKLLPLIERFKPVPSWD